MSFISLSTSEALTYPKMYSYLYSEVFTEEFAHISFIDWFIQHFMPKNMVKLFFYGSLEYFVICGGMKRDTQNSPSKNYYL